MCGSLCLVIRTVNDRDAWRDRERAWGKVRPGGEGGGGEGAGDLSHTRASLQATIACVVIVLKAWRPGPEPPPRLLCAGDSVSRAFPLLLVACEMSLFSGRRSI